MRLVERFGIHQHSGNQAGFLGAVGPGVERPALHAGIAGFQANLFFIEDQPDLSGNDDQVIDRPGLVHAGMLLPVEPIPGTHLLEILFHLAEVPLGIRRQLQHPKHGFACRWLQGHPVLDGVAVAGIVIGDGARQPDIRQLDIVLSPGRGGGRTCPISGVMVSSIMITALPSSSWPVITRRISRGICLSSSVHLEFASCASPKV